jgi:serine/threonine-protein kinase RsbW
MKRLIDTITDDMVREGYPENEIAYVHLALEEAIVNAHKHGHQGDWSKELAVRYHVNAAIAVAQVEDQGTGFEPEEVPDPLAPENMERPTGRGLLLIRSFMTRVCHNGQGNCVCFCKHGRGRQLTDGQTETSTRKEEN